MEKTQNTKVCIKGDGTEEYGKKIIDYLGGHNPFLMKGAEKSFYYYVNGNGWLRDEVFQPEGYTEIFLNKPNKCMTASDLIGLVKNTGQFPPSMVLPKDKVWHGEEVVSILKEYENGFDSMNSLIEKYGLEEYNYHTPKIEEFHVGFKFEYKKDNTSIWVKHNMACLNYRVENTMDIDRLLHFYPERFRALNK